MPLNTCGSLADTRQALRSKPEPETPGEEGEGPPTLKLSHFISVSLRPDDPFAKRLLATPITTNNLLLKVTVPKRTGRKRKRGSSGPFLSEQEISSSSGGTPEPRNSSKSPYVDAKTVFRSVKDNATKHTVTPVGVVDETHRFRSKTAHATPTLDLSLTFMKHSRTSSKPHTRIKSYITFKRT
jgi:general transcription factor 3C polypeptide 5 (transcription factor C subunit 1)